jgi:hypothetical protein
MTDGFLAENKIRHNMWLAFSDLAELNGAGVVLFLSRQNSYCFRDDRLDALASTTKPIRLNPKRTNTRGEPIQGMEIWRTLTRSG